MILKKIKRDSWRSNNEEFERGLFSRYYSGGGGGGGSRIRITEGCCLGGNMRTCNGAVVGVGIGSIKWGNRQHVVGRREKVVIPFVDTLLYSSLRIDGNGNDKDEEVSKVEATSWIRCGHTTPSSGGHNLVVRGH